MSHISPSQVTVWVGNQWIDEAAHIEFSEIAPRELYYGYHDTYFRATAPSRSVVSGNITINFRYLGYLTKAIMAAKIGRLSPEDAKGCAASSTWLKSRQTANLLGIATADEYALTVTDSLQTYDSVLAAKKDSFGYIKDYLEDKFWGTQSTVDIWDPSTKNINKIATTAYPNPTHKNMLLSPYIMLQYGEDAETGSPEFVEIIEDVHFTGVGKRIDNSRAELSGEPIKERYEFVARRIRPLVEGPING